MDKLERAIQRAEEMFFGECDPMDSEHIFAVVFLCSWSGPVPAIVLFTKFDALTTVAVGKLPSADRQLPLRRRLSMAKPLVEDIFNHPDVCGRLSRMRYAPKAFVRVGGSRSISRVHAVAGTRYLSI